MRRIERILLLVPKLCLGTPDREALLRNVPGANGIVADQSTPFLQRKEWSFGVPESNSHFAPIPPPCTGRQAASGNRSRLANAIDQRPTDRTGVPLAAGPPVHCGAVDIGRPAAWGGPNSGRPSAPRMMKVTRTPAASGSLRVVLTPAVGFVRPRIARMHPSSFPSSAWERPIAKFCFATRRLCEWRRTARRSTRCQAEPGDECVPKRSLGTRRNPWQPCPPWSAVPLDAPPAPEPRSRRIVTRGH